MTPNYWKESDDDHALKTSTFIYVCIPAGGLYIISLLIAKVSPARSMPSLTFTHDRSGVMIDGTKDSCICILLRYKFIMGAPFFFVLACCMIKFFKTHLILAFLDW